MIASFDIFYAKTIYAIEKTIKMKQNILYNTCNLKEFKCYFLSLKRFPRGLKENPQEEDNLSTRDN